MFRAECNTMLQFSMLRLTISAPQHTAAVSLRDIFNQHLETRLTICKTKRLTTRHHSCDCCVCFKALSVRVQKHTFAALTVETGLSSCRVTWHKSADVSDETWSDNTGSAARGTEGREVKGQQRCEAAPGSSVIVIIASRAHTDVVRRVTASRLSWSCFSFYFTLDKLKEKKLKYVRTVWVHGAGAAAQRAAMETSVTASQYETKKQQHKTHSPEPLASFHKPDNTEAQRWTVFDFFNNTF